jgi:hypothetical protein
VSSPSDRSFDTKGVSPYAPRWARDLDRARIEAERLGSQASLDPTIMPEPPMPEAWRLSSERSRARGGGGSGAGAFIPYLFAIFLAGLVAFVIVVELPKIMNFVSKQRSVASWLAERFNSEVPQLQSAPSEPTVESVGRSERAPTSAERRVAATNSAAVAPFVPESPVSRTEPTVADSTPQHSLPERLLPANPGPAVVSLVPPVAEVEPSAAPAHVEAVKTESKQVEKPARPLGREEIETLLKQGKDFVSVGDFASARMVFGRVWEANDARGALGLAETYDPALLAKIGAVGATPDVAKAREWYVKARAADKTVGMASTGNESTNAQISQNSPPSEAPAPSGSYWKQAESIMRLEARGADRKFFFYKPSDAQLKAGAKAGSLRFDGQISGNVYTGTAFSYSDKCGRSSFTVSGEIENNNNVRVTLSGRSPRLDGDCREIGIADQKLVFDFVGAAPE